MTATSSPPAERFDRDALVAELEAAGGTVRGDVVRCPYHDDGKPSGSVYRSEDGSWRYRCHGCDASGDALDLQARREGRPVADILRDRNGNGTTPAPRKPATTKPKQRFRTPADAWASVPGRLVAEWVYPGGTYCVARFDTGDGKSYRPAHDAGDGWVLGDPSGDLPLYRSDELPPEGIIYVCEGEKATDAAWEVGIPAVTSAHGFQSPHKSDWRPLAGRDVVLLPDNDTPGEEYASHVAKLLTGLNPAAKVRIVRLPGLEHKGDLYDWTDADGPAGCKTEEEIREWVQSLVDAAPEWTPPPPEPGDDAGHSQSPTRAAMLRRAASVVTRPVAWLWPGRFPLGKVSLLIGNPGQGKSLFTAHLAAKVSRGGRWPDGTECPQGEAIMLSGEDDPEDTTAPRLRVAGADLERVHFLEGVLHGDSKHPDRPDLFRLDVDMDLLRDVVAQTRAKLLTIDPVSSFVGKVDDHKNAELRGLLSALAALAAEQGVAVVCVSHLRKAGGPAVHQAVGSLAYTAAARAVWAWTIDPDEDERRLLVPVKVNLGRDTSGLACAVIPSASEPDIPTLRWEPEPITGRADRYLNPDKDPGRPPRERTEAEEWLTIALLDGPRPARDLLREAETDGITASTLRRAKTTLGVTADKGGFDGGWTWKMP